MYQYRVRVPADLRTKIGSTHINRSLKTACLTVATRSVRTVAYEIERFFENARAPIGSLETSIPHLRDQHADRFQGSEGTKPTRALTFADVCHRYLNDPTRSRTDKSAVVYRATYAAFTAIFGSEIQAASITREMCREALTVFQSLPSNASKRWPNLTLQEVSAKARDEGIQPMSVANVNEYMNKLSTLFNWAVKEEIIARNPSKGLRITDTVAPRDKRRPFSAAQLRRIFNAPLYRGCRDDGLGYATAGTARPRRARYWIPLLALWTAMRQNEICQLHTADVRKIEGILCIVVCAGEAIDKHLKTAASERWVPIHPMLIRLGFPEYVGERRRNGDERLFPELSLDTFGHYSSKFSKWFARFLVRAGAEGERTCFHSFRHCFRDALREAKVDREVALAIGGWTSSSGAGSGAVADAYGRGFSPQSLFDAISKVDYPTLDLSHLHPNGRR